MKKATTMAIAALAFTASAFASTAYELAMARDWEKLSQRSFTEITNVMPKAHAADVYNACLATSNYVRAALLVINGYTSTIEQGYADAKSRWPNRKAFEAAWKIAFATSNIVQQFEIAEEASKAQAFNNAFTAWTLAQHNKIKTHEPEFLRIATEALERRDFITAVAPIFTWPRFYGSAIITDETDTLKSWRDANAPAIMAGLASMENVKDIANVYRTALYHLSLRDSEAKDQSNSYAMQFFNAKFFKDEFGPMHCGIFSALGRESYEAYMANSTNASCIFNTMTSILPNTIKRAEINKWWAKLAVDPIVARKAAILINDNDKLLTALVNSTENMTTDDVNSAIEMVVSFDADYRTEDVLKVLKNINSKYTLKLYNDHDTWEPVISKIRALIDSKM